MEKRVKNNTEKVTEAMKNYEELKKEMKERMNTPEMKELRKNSLNLSAHIYVSGAFKRLFCPVCGANWKNLSWKCHDISVKEAIKMLEEMAKYPRGKSK